MSNSYTDWFILLWLIILSVCSYIAHKEGREDMVNELCNIKVYEFCQQENVKFIYKEILDVAED